MKDSKPSQGIPSEIAQGLDEVRRRDFRIRCLQGLLRGLALGLAIMLAAMLLDLVIGWLSPWARWTMTLGSLGFAVLGFSIWLVIPLIRRPSGIDIARTIDKATPNLEERWSTVAELSNNQDPENIRGSESLIRAVKEEARSLNFHVNAEKIIPDAPLKLASRWLAGVCALLLVFVVWDVAQARVLLTRFWLPSADASLTKIELLTTAQNVPLREAFKLEAKISGRIHEDATYVSMRSPGGEETLHLMLSNESDQSRFAFPIKSVNESFEFRVQSGDGRTDWQAVTAVSRPKITAIRLDVEAPSYSELPHKKLTSLPHRLRILDGSKVDLQFKADQPLTELRLEIDDKAPQPLTLTDDGWYRFVEQPKATMAFKAVLRNAHDLENKTKPRSRFIVYQDLPPTVRVLDPTRDTARKANDTVAIEFEANDDFGIKEAAIIVSQTDNEGNELTTRLPIDLKEAQGEKSIRKEIELDLSQFALEQGDQLSYAISVTDTRESQANSDPEDSENTLDNLAQSPDESQKSEREYGDSTSDEALSNSKDTSKRLVATEQLKESEPAESQNGSSPPPNDMAMRSLDTGQSSECKPRNITIDEWAGSFEGDNEEKLQLAIDPVLQRLKGLLAQALDFIESAQSEAADPSSNDSDPLLELVVQSRDQLRQSESAIAELISKSSGTPYAFIGLQLQNIESNHIVPAQESLIAIKTEETEKTDARLESGRFHVERAIADLNELDQSYEAVKREKKIEDAMQRLAKMHQVFLENSQKLLGSKKPALNSYDRKLAEVDDDYVEQLKELLEEKKQIMDELAKLLAEDPRLLRRYLAMMELQGTSQRDQMTLLALRQQTLKEQVQSWHQTEESKRSELARAIRQQYAARMSDTLEGSTKMHENMETWLPLTIDPQHVAIAPLTLEAQQLIEELGHAFSEVSRDELDKGLEHATTALEHLRSLHEHLPLLSDEIGDEPKIDVYIANRLEEVETLISNHSGWMRIMTALEEDDFSKAAEIVQHTLEQDTTTLKDKIVVLQGQVSSMSEEIGQTADELVRIVQTDILYTQSLATENLADGNWESALEMETHLVTAYSLAESSFDRLLNLMIEKMDESPAPSAPGANKSLDDLLTMLENEMKAQESLGIPNRPINVSLMTDWMKPESGSTPSNAMAQAQAKAAQAQAAQAKAEADRLQKAANAAAKALQAKHQGTMAGGASQGTGPAAPKKSWNILVSQLEKDILQGRDSVPPEKYRDAINAYFQTIADKVPATER